MRERWPSCRPGGRAALTSGESIAGASGPAPEAKTAETMPRAPAVADEPQLCLKHPGQLMTTKCYVCSKPMCPQCMELFGYVCSPLCKARADSHGIDVPIYEGQRSFKQARM